MCRTRLYTSRHVLETVLAFHCGGGALLVRILVRPAAQSNPPSTDLFNELHWRSIGPFRGGRMKAATGVPSQPNLFYVAAVNGGVWKSTDMADLETDLRRPADRSIGAIAVAPSDPSIIYVGSARAFSGPICPRATASTSPPTPEDMDASGPPGRPADPADHRGPDESRSPVRRRPRPSVWGQRGTRHLSLDRRRQDRLRRSSTRTRTQAASTWRSIPRTRITSTPSSGKRARVRGRTARFAGPAAASSNRPTAAAPGDR